jgi:hypothetical protein
MDGSTLSFNANKYEMIKEECAKRILGLNALGTFISTIKQERLGV